MLELAAETSYNNGIDLVVQMLSRGYQGGDGGRNLKERLVRGMEGELWVVIREDME